MKNSVYFIIILTFVFISCSTYHTYEVTVVNRNNTPIQNALVQYYITDHDGYPVSNDSIFTNIHGKAIISQKIDKYKVNDSKVYYSSINLLIKKYGFYHNPVNLNSYYQSDQEYQPNIPKNEIVTSTIYLDSLFHYYKLQVNIQGNSVDKANIKYQLINSSDTISKSATTNYLTDYIKPAYNPDYPHLQDQTKLVYYVSLPGYKPIKDSLFNNYVGILPYNFANQLESSVILKPFNHIYKISIQDETLNDLPGCNIKYTITNGSSIITDNISLTEPEFEIKTNPIFKDGEVDVLQNPTKLTYEISKFGYVTQSGVITNSFGDKNSSDISDTQIIVVKLTRKSNEELSQLSWNKTYNNILFQKVPNSYTDAVSGIGKIIYGYVDKKNDKSDEPTDKVLESYIDEAARFIQDVVEIYPSFIDSAEAHFDDLINFGIGIKGFNSFSPIWIDLGTIFYYAFPENPYFALQLANYLIYISNLGVYHTFGSFMFFQENHENNINIQLEYAYDLLEEIINNNPFPTSHKYHQFSLCKLAEVCILLEKNDQASNILEKSTIINRYDPFYNYVYGSYLYLKEEYQSAVQYLLNAYNGLQNFREPYYKDIIIKKILSCYEEIEMYDDALQLINNLLAGKLIESDKLKYLKHKIRFLILLENTKDAISTANAILNLDKNDDFAYYVLGISYFETNPRESIKNYLKYIELVTENPEAYISLSKLYFNLNDCKNSKKYLDLAYEDYDGDLSDLQENIDKKCSPEKFVSAWASTLYHCPRNWGYDEDCIYMLDVEFTNNSYKRISKVNIEVKITYKGRIYYREQGWLNVKLNPSDVLRHKLKLKNEVTAYGASASDFNINITVLDVQ